MTTPRTIPDPVADLVRDPIIHFNTHTRWSVLTREMSENDEAKKALKAMLVFLGIAQATWSSQEASGGNSVPYTRVGIQPCSRAAEVRMSVGKYRGLLTNARGVDGAPVTPEQILQRWDKDRFDETRGVSKKSRSKGEASVPPLPGDTFLGGDDRLDEFLRLCCEKRDALDTITTARMGTILAEMEGVDFARPGKLYAMIEEGEKRGLIVAMNEDRTTFGFEKDLLPLSFSPASDDAAAPAASAAPAALASGSVAGAGNPEPVRAEVTLPADIPPDLVSLMQNTGNKMRERERLIAHRAQIQADIQANTDQQAALQRAKADLERQMNETDASIAKLDKFHRALEALRALDEQAA